MGRGSPAAVLALCLLFCWAAIATAKPGWRRDRAGQTAQWGSARRLPNTSTASRRFPYLNSVFHGHQHRHRTPWAATGSGGRAMAMAGGGGPWAATGSGGGGGGSWTVAGGGRGGPWAVTSAGGGSQWTVVSGGRHPQHAINGRTWPSRPATSARRLPWPATGSTGTGWAHTGHHGLPDHRHHYPWNFFQMTHHGSGPGDCHDGRRRPAAQPPRWPGQRPEQRPEEPEQRPEQRPEEPEQRPEQRPVEPEQRPEQRPVEPEQRPVDRPEQRPVDRPEQRPVDRPERRPEDRADQRPVEPTEEPVAPDQEDGSGFFPVTVPEKTDCPEGAVFLDGKCVCRDPTPFLDTILERCVDTRPAIY